MSYKQIIAMRTDLNMRKGKMVAQGGHAVALNLLMIEHVTIAKEKVMAAWIDDGMRKICVGVDGAEELEVICLRAESAGITVCRVTDRGDTEFNGVPTLTCAAIGPDSVERIDQITGTLKLL